MAVHALVPSGPSVSLAREVATSSLVTPCRDRDPIYALLKHGRAYVQRSQADEEARHRAH